jgi:hypothetical protein
MTSSRRDQAGLERVLRNKGIEEDEVVEHRHIGVTAIASPFVDRHARRAIADRHSSRRPARGRWPTSGHPDQDAPTGHNP